MTGVLKARQVTAQYVSAGFAELATNLSAEGTILFEPQEFSSLMPSFQDSIPTLTFKTQYSHAGLTNAIAARFQMMFLP